MRNLKKLALQLPEYLLIAGVVFYWVSTGTALNFIAIGLILGLVIQIITRNQVFGMVIACLLVLASLYMVLALFSELSEFPSFNAAAWKLLVVGLSYLGSIMVVSGVMMYKYTALKERVKLAPGVQ